MITSQALKLAVSTKDAPGEAGAVGGLYRIDWWRVHVGFGGGGCFT
jgi:hypothetical protein